MIVRKTEFICSVKPQLCLNSNLLPLAPSLTLLSMRSNIGVMALNFELLKNLYFVGKFGSKMQNLGLKCLIGEIYGKIKNFSAHNLPCQKFVTVCWNSLGVLQCLAGKLQLLSCLLF